MLRTLIGAMFAAAWIMFSPGCTMPTRSDGFLSRLSNAPEDDSAADDVSPAEERRSSATRQPDAPPDSDAQTTLASDTHSTPPSHTPLESRQPAGLDAATMYLIQSELRDLPAAERQRWMTYLQTIDPEMVPHVLQARRMTVDATRSTTPEQQQPAATLAQSAASGPSQAGAAYQPRSRTGTGTMSQMNLNAPEPAGATAATAPFAVQPAYQPTSDSQTAYDRSNAAMSVTQASHQAQGELPRISPGNHGPAPDAATGRDPVTPTNFESTDGVSLEPMASGQDAYLQEALQRVIALTEAEVAASHPGYTEQERTEYIRRHVALRMLHFMSEQPQRAQQAIPDLDPAEQEFWTELFWSLSNYFDVDTIPDPTERAGLASAQLVSAARHLQHQAALELWNTCFCHKINSFGNFERYDRDEFRAGQPVLLYAELRNFESEPTNSGHFRTRLKSHIEIRRGGVDGERIEYNSFPPTEDLCRAPRNDYFHSYKIDLPHHLRPGPHALVLTVEDMLSGKVATEVLEFTIR